jgi:enterochelin esterase-like enzyme
MNKSLSGFSSSSFIRRHSSIILFLLSLCIAILAGLLLFSQTIIGGLTSTIIDIGLDSQRAQLIVALLMTAGAALIGAIWGRRKLGAMLGGGTVFWFGYLAGFIQLQLQPTRDPGGNLEVLNVGALVDTSLTMLALALLSAFIGAAIGVALGEVLLDPLYGLVRLTWQGFVRTNKNISQETREVKEDRIFQPGTVRGTIASWSGAILMITLLVLASGSGDLFSFSPDVGIHTLPDIPSKGRVAVHGTIVQDSVVSPALRGQRKPFLVYLPPSYNTPKGQTKRYPTLYLLHGSPGKDNDWFTGGKADQAADTLIALGKIPELIMILPDGNGRPGETSEWGNSGDGRQLIETYVAIDLVKYVDQKYRTITDPAHRGIGGNSMGGFGATNIAIHHPDVFGFVISLGGYYYAEGSIWGNSLTYLQANSPADVLPHDKQAQKLQLYIGAATKDQPYYAYSQQFVQELGKLHMHYYFDVQQGYHSWKVWQVQIYDALLWVRWG